jgi:TolA-binding protein
VHVLTKIFIVLVTALALAIVPLVAVNATNEGRFKQRWMDEQGKYAAAAADLASLQSQKTALQAELEKQIAELNTTIASLRRDNDLKASDVRKLQSDLASAKAMQASINSNLEIMAQSGKQAVTTNETLVKEVRDLRERVIARERESVELEEVVSTLQSQLEVADAARKALQEELQKVNEEKGVAMAQVAKFIASYGELPTASAGELRGDAAGRVPADRDLSATILDVKRINDQSLVELNVGSRDGVKEGWTLIVGDGGNFIANVRIIKVDVNRSTGVVELENSARGGVARGQKAIARRGE